MTIEVEVPDQKAMALLKQLEELNILKLVRAASAQPEMDELNHQKAENQLSDEERSAIIRSLYGAIPYNQERYEEQMQFLHEIRNEWER